MASFFNPSGHSPFAPTYAHISSIPLKPTTKLISIAGQVGHDSQSNTIASGLGAQVELALQNLDKCLNAAGAKKTDIVSVRQYVVNLLPQDSSRAKLYTEFMGGHKPPSTLIGVQSLAHKDLLYEIEVMVVLDEGQ